MRASKSFSVQEQGLFKYVLKKIKIKMLYDAKWLYTENFYKFGYLSQDINSEFFVSFSPISLI